MKVLFTGASSFSGVWYARELARQGHEVVAVYQKRGIKDYKGVDARRVKLLSGVCRQVFGCTFGGKKFMHLINNDSRWDVFCAHGAVVGKARRSKDYDIDAAFNSATHNLEEVLQGLKSRGCNAIVWTGTFSQRGEGKGTDGLPAIRRYDVAKQITMEMFAFLARETQMRFGRFIMPHPFGPYDKDDSFATFAARQWRAGKVVEVQTPDYVRDPMHISLLALIYADFAARFVRGKKQTAVIRPSGYAESIGAFTKRYAREMQKRWNIPCQIKLTKQKDFSEPLIRTLTTRPDIKTLKWNEKESWNAIADYYANGGKGL